MLRVTRLFLVLASVFLPLIPLSLAQAQTPVSPKSTFEPFIPQPGEGAVAVLERMKCSSDYLSVWMKDAGIKTVTGLHRLQAGHQYSMVETSNCNPASDSDEARLSRVYIREDVLQGTVTGLRAKLAALVDQPTQGSDSYASGGDTVLKAVYDGVVGERDAAQKELAIAVRKVYRWKWIALAAIVLAGAFFYLWFYEFGRRVSLDWKRTKIIEEVEGTKKALEADLGRANATIHELKTQPQNQAPEPEQLIGTPAVEEEVIPEALSASEETLLEEIPEWLRTIGHHVEEGDPEVVYAHLPASTKELFPSELESPKIAVNV